MSGKVQQVRFAIGKIIFCVESDADIDVKSYLFTPQPFNLNINYLLEQVESDSYNAKIVIRSGKEKLRVDCKGNELTIVGNISPMFAKGYNQQFGLFGNKGIFNRFILHILEKNRAITLHACAVVHPQTSKVFIGIGASGSGKSVFVSNALKNGWRLIASEHVTIDEEMTVYKGNQYDNITPGAIPFIENELQDAVVYKDKELREPTGSKFLGSLGAYGSEQSSFSLQHGYSIILLAFGNDDFKKGPPVHDSDFLLRIMQQTASEKICFPVIFNDQILTAASMEGDPSLRSRLVNKLIAEADSRVLLGGSYQDIDSWLKDGN